MSIQLGVTLNEPGSHRPGDWVRGNVHVDVGGDCRALTVALHFRERTSDYSANARTDGLTELHSGDLAPGTSFPFQLQLPTDALPNYNSSHGELFWLVEAKADKRGVDKRAQCRVEVETGG